ncbi:hypothetical protein CSA17_00085 [bacterium DOLJORAL78_65_58]|nr:MAG: hypothetical protein CSA17_00085 [bacterium DOLJORAL78_65_58]
MKNWTILLIIALLLPVTAFGQFADNGQVNNEYDRADPALSFWASEVVDSERGYQDYQQPELGYASVGTETDMLGPDGSYFCLGDHGTSAVCPPFAGATPSPAASTFPILLCSTTWPATSWAARASIWKT